MSEPARSAAAERVPVGSEAPAPRPPDTAADVRLAWLHLRLGMLAAADAELEELHHRGVLDRDGLAALAEVRWRSGDLSGAGEAARAHLDAGGLDPVATIVAAEEAAAAGEVATARQLVDRMRRLDAVAIDALFAGMPRKASWPAASSESSTASGGGTAGGAGTGVAAGAPPATPGSSSDGTTRSVPGPSEVMASTPGLWEGERGQPAAAAGPEPGQPRSGVTGPNTPGRWAEPARPRGHADPDAELELARQELESDPERGLLRLALVLRLDPTLAPDVIDALRLRREPLAALLRGDAERLVGRHLEAEAAFADAAEAIERDALASRPATRHHRPPDQGAEHQETS